MAASRSSAAPSSITARHALIETFAYYKYQVTDFEASLWSRLIDEYGDEAVKAFLQAHVCASNFAPRIADAQKLLSPERGNEEAAFLRLMQEVKRSGPYADPAFADPALAAAVVHMGGWATVNEQLPDPHARFDFDAYQKRFQAAYQLARAEQMSAPSRAVQLRGLHALGQASQALRIQAEPAGTRERLTA